MNKEDIENDAFEFMAGFRQEIERSPNKSKFDFPKASIRDASVMKFDANIPRQKKEEPIQGKVGPAVPCCLYPDESYPDADTPDQVELWIDTDSDGILEFIAILVRCPTCGSKYYTDTGLPGASHAIHANGDGSGWEFTTAYGDGQTNRCLFGDVTGFGDRFSFHDSYPNSLTISISDDPTSYVVTRDPWPVEYSGVSTPRCTWMGDGFSIRYSAADFKWHLSGLATILMVPTLINTIRDNPQDGPVGNYSSGAIVVS